MILRHHSVPRPVFEALRGMVVSFWVELRKRIENQVPDKGSKPAKKEDMKERKSDITNCKSRAIQSVL